jgi:multiple antibiotic resistance protein
MALGGFGSWQVLDILVSLLIGMGPKVAVVPFLDLTAGLDSDSGKAVAKRMVRAAVTVAVVLVVLGALMGLR